MCLADGYACRPTSTHLGICRHFIAWGLYWCNQWNTDCLPAHPGVYRDAEYAFHYQWLHLCDNRWKSSSLCRAGIYTDRWRRPARNPHSIYHLCALCASGGRALTLYRFWTVCICRWLKYRGGTYCWRSGAAHAILFLRARKPFYGGCDIAGIATLYGRTRFRARLRAQRNRNRCAWWYPALRWTWQHARDLCRCIAIHHHWQYP